MLIEDNPNFTKVMEDMLESQFSSIHLMKVGNWLDALRQIASGPPDLIFMDIRLPTLSGLELTQKIKADYPDIIIVILTAYDSPEYREAAIRYKADYFFSKDEMGKVVNLLKSILSEKGLRADGDGGVQPIERRASTRTDVQVPINMNSSNTLSAISGMTRDISLGGMKVNTKISAMPFQTSDEVTFLVNQDYFKFQGQGEILWISPTGSTVGIKFAQLEEEARRSLNEFLHLFVHAPTSNR
ncbi:MAG TPA: response regulator [Thermodesulfobacteriota bacterium]|nr:response regulator [Thermodesulfobacteriota bacterium]